MNLSNRIKLKALRGLLFFIFITFISSCQNKSKIQFEHSLFKNLRQSEVGNYNFQDTLIKYEKFQSKDFLNRADYHIFIANNAAVLGDYNKFSSNIKIALSIDSSQVCSQFISPIVEHLASDNPNHRNILPPILDLSFDDFYKYYDQCKTCCKSEILPGENEEYDYKTLYVLYLSIKDQWFRGPDRSMESAKQIELDKFCRNQLDQLYQDSNDKLNLKMRSAIFAIILHSVDCEWSLRWYKKYVNSFSDYKRIKNHINYFMIRSECNTQQEVIDYYQSIKDL